VIRGEEPGDLFDRHLAYQLPNTTMAGSKRARSTSLAVEDTSREKQRKQAPSRSNMEDDDVSVEYVQEEREVPEVSQM
jgi:hypothetical protein